MTEKKKKFWNQAARWDDPAWVAKMHCRIFGHMKGGKRCVCGTYVSMMKRPIGYEKCANPDQDLREKEGYF